MFFSVFKIFASNIFSFSSFLEGFKKGWKGIIKSILLLLLAIYCIGVFGFMYIAVMFSVYKSLVLAGTTQLMPLISLGSALIVTFFFGLTSVATNYFTGSGEEQFLSMPISSTSLFGAKFAVSFITDALIGLVLFLIGSIIYGYNEHLLTHPMFYVGLLVSAIAISVLAIAVIYFLLILILTVCPKLRKKSFLTAVSSVLVIAFSMVYGLLSSKISSVMSVGFNSEEFAGVSNPIASAFGGIAEKYPVLTFLADALNGKILPILCMLIIIAAIVFGLVPLMGKFYVKTFNGFSDVKTKKLTSKKAEEVLQKDVHTSSIFHAVYWRDVRTVLREPAFFSNGPLIIFLMPVILVFSFTIGFASTGTITFSQFVVEIQNDFAEFSPEKIQSVAYYITIIASAFCLFIGNSTSVAASSFSREGKNLYTLKAMPIQNSIIAKAKFAHAFTYTVIAYLMISLIMLVLLWIIKLPLAIIEIVKIFVFMFLLMTVVSCVLIFSEMFIDTLRPKLNWENPIAAFKQNMNSFISVFITMATIALFCVLALLLLPKNSIGIVILIIIFTIIAAPIGALYFRYAEKRITLM